MNTSNLKDKISTALAILLVLLGAVNTYIQANAGKPVDYTQLSLFVISAVISYLTGKNPNGSTKTDEQAAKLNNPQPISNPIIVPKPEEPKS